MAERQVTSRANSDATQVGSGIPAPAGVWTFGGDTPRSFDEHVAASLPLYAECHELILDIADQLVPVGGRCYDLGCSTGALTARLAHRLAPRDVTVIGVDQEPDMIELAVQRVADSPAIRFVASPVEELELDAADLVICFYTLQFVHPRHRPAVFERIRRALEPGGALILFEKVMAPTAQGQDVAEGVYFDFKRRNDFTNDEIAEKTRSLRGVLKPLPAEANYVMLERAGFSAVIQVFRWMTFDGLVAYAP